ncbi:hypothetical protein M2202_009520 [Bradyrhizobium japonicum]|nr:hypothetical protein [Bradyrhizobium japonicum]MCP1794812.1 hypothetical protein [Bradyrhizobium japonicum]MCP1810737.1 hypothetical protein [Bradyrhizobium japonicum]MCP1821494.1 hypothetical protein [Bradyrhizobium japonicum]MCP1876492.1 hypothetical protein [Bradyrhizobium japonicum]
MKRSNIRGAKGPCHLQCLQHREGKDEMTKASIDCKRVFYRTGYARGWPRRRVTPGPSSVIGTAWLT